MIPLLSGCENKPEIGEQETDEPFELRILPVSGEPYLGQPKGSSCIEMLPGQGFVLLLQDNHLHVLFGVRVPCGLGDEERYDDQSLVEAMKAWASMQAPVVARRVGLPVDRPDPIRHHNRRM